MLDKRELSKIELPRLPEHKYIDKEKDLNYFCQARIIIDSQDHEHLMLAIWKRVQNGYTDFPAYITFIDKDTDDFCTLDLYETVYKDENGVHYKPPRIVRRTKPKWSSSMLENLIGSRWNRISGRRHLNLWIVNDGSVRTISKYFNIKKYTATIDDIDDFQKSIREKELTVRKAKRRADINRIMSQITSLPADWDDFMVNYAALPYRYVFYKRETNSKITGYCSHCRRDLRLTKDAAHNVEGICPSCNSKIVYKAVGKSKTLQDHFGSDYLQPVQGGFILRCFENNWYFRNSGRETKKQQFEKLRYYIDYSGKITMYDKAFDSQEGESLWRKRSYLECSPPGRLYPHNLNSLGNTHWKYSAIDILAKNSVMISTTGYLTHYLSIPLLEYIVKLGLYNVAAQKSRQKTFDKGPINWKGTDIFSTFELPKDYIPLLKKIEAGFEDVGILQHAYNKRVEITDTDFKAFWKAKLSVSDIKELILACSKFPFKVSKVLKYFIDQRRSGEAIGDVITTWNDYINLADQLQYNLQDEYYLFPKKLIESHDKANEIVQVRKNAKADRLIKKRWKGLNEKYYFESDEYLIRAPKSAAEFVHEANKLKHCVATNYMKPHAEGATTILFIRKKSAPEEPFYTLELKDGKIRQCQSRSHMPTTPEVRKFTGLWMKEKVDSERKTEAEIRVQAMA